MEDTVQLISHILRMADALTVKDNSLYMMLRGTNAHNAAEEDIIMNKLELVKLMDSLMDQVYKE